MAEIQTSILQAIPDGTAPVDLTAFSKAEGLGALASLIVPLAATRGYSAQVVKGLYGAWCALYPDYADTVKDEDALVPFLESVVNNAPDSMVLEAVTKQFDRLVAAYETVLERSNKYKTVAPEIFDAVKTLPAAAKLTMSSTTAEIVEEVVSFARTLFAVIQQMRTALVAAAPKKGKGGAVGFDDSQLPDNGKTAYKALNAHLLSRATAALTYLLLLHTKNKSGTVSSIIRDAQLNFDRDGTLVPCTMAQARNTMATVMGTIEKSDILFSFVKENTSRLAPVLAQEVTAAAQSPLSVVLSPIIQAL